MASGDLTAGWLREVLGPPRRDGPASPDPAGRARRPAPAGAAGAGADHRPGGPHRLAARARYQLAWFAGEQPDKITGEGGELMLLRDLRDRSRAAGLPFDDLLAEAAACSNARTADFLLGVVREAPA